jgi:hypothetical protein
MAKNSKKEFGSKIKEEFSIFYPLLAQVLLPSLPVRPSFFPSLAYHIFQVRRELVQSPRRPITLIQVFPYFNLYGFGTLNLVTAL